MRLELLDDAGVTMLAVVIPGVDLEGMTREQRDRAAARWLFADVPAPYVSRKLRQAHLRSVWRRRPRDRWRAAMRAAQRQLRCKSWRCLR
jgi:hypothetical protein